MAPGGRPVTAVGGEPSSRPRFCGPVARPASCLLESEPMRARCPTWPLVAVLTACGGPRAVVRPDASRLDVVTTFQARAPELFVFVVDDTSAGAALRASLAEAVASYDARRAAASTSCMPPFDPAAFHPVNRDAWVVHPSRSGAERVSGYPNEPALRWRTNQRTDAEAAQWASAVVASIEEAAPSTTAFRPLESLSETAALLDHRRSPANQGEGDLLDALDPSVETLVTLAAATEDASPDTPESYAAPLGNRLFLGEPVVPARVSTEERPCAQRGAQASPRFQAWLDATGTSDAALWPCAEPPFLVPLVDDCVPGCLAKPVEVNADGSADCTVTARLPADDQCPVELGWLDPLDDHGVRTPRVEHDPPLDYRVCEVRQLDGTALTSCRTSLACEDCEPGFCVTEVPELVPSERCRAGELFPPFRFVDGAGEARNAVVTISCRLAEP